MILLQLILILQAGHIASISVDPVYGHDNLDCFKGIHPCKHLDFVFEYGTTYIDNNEIVLVDGIHNVEKEIKLIYHTNITLKSATSAVINCSRNNSGFTFIYTNLFKLERIQVENCGVIHDGTTVISNETRLYYLNNQKVQIAFCFIYTQAIYINNCVFINNRGIGVAFFSTNKTINIYNSVFTSNSNYEDFVPHPKEMFISGGGIYIEYTTCYGLESYSCDGHLSYNQNTKITITNCSFYNNSADNRYSNPITKYPLDKTYVTYGKGGGIAINVFGDAKNNSFKIEECTFFNNSAMFGGGLSITFQDESELNSFEVWNSNFSSNKATYAGGGLRIETFYHDDYEQKCKTNVTFGNEIKVHNSSFSNNFAIWGGGISDTATTRLVYGYNSSSRDMLIDNCTFQSNFATIGYAVGLKSINFNKAIIGPGMTYRARIKNSTFEKNFMVQTEDKKVIGQGALYSDKVTLVFDGKNYFKQNNHTALVLDFSSLLLGNKSQSLFINNHGIEGGGIALFGISWIMLGYKSSIKFKENEATSRGGAMYIQSSGPRRLAFKSTGISSAHCFIRYINPNINPNKWPVYVSFIGNKAPDGTGNSVYASTLQHCRQDGEARNNISALEWKSFRYINTSNNQSEVVTNAIGVSVIHDKQWSSYPFLPFSPNISLIDEKNQNVFGSIELSIKGLENPVKLDPPSNMFFIRNNISRLRLIGKTQTNYTFKFASTDGQQFESEQFKGELTRCPPGFRPDPDNDKCICMDSDYRDVMKCYENGTVYILEGKWGYLDEEGILKTIQCPKHKCECKNRFAGYLCQLDLENQCIENRTGILCGSCTTGLSVKIGTEKCGNCGNGNIFKIGALLIIGMFIFIMIISYLDLNAFSGYLNGFIYSYQMISVLLVTPSLVNDNNALSFIIGIISFSGTGNTVGFCLYHKMNNLEKLGINYVAPVLAMIITIFIGILAPSRLWNKIFRRNDNNNFDDVRQKSFGRAFSFVSVLCYSSITETTFRLFHFVSIKKDYILYNAAPTSFNGPVYKFYFIIAILCTIFIIIGFPLILMFQPYFTNRFQIFRKIDPIVETLKNCFKPTYRPFAAFYFICRIVLVLLGSLIQDEIVKLVVLTFCCVIILVIFAYVQPYERWTYNFFDTLLLSNLVFISLLNIIINVPVSVDNDSRKFAEGLCYSLAWLPLVIAVLRLIWYLLPKNVPEEANIQLSSYQRMVLWVRNEASQVVEIRDFPHRVLERDN